MNRSITAAPLALFGALALAACGSSEESTPAAMEGSPTAETPTFPPVLPTAIPAAMQGRWGLVAADCTSTMGDAKGLLDVGPTTLKFYESRGTLGTVTEGDDDEIRAMFAFTGEGMEWQREMELELDDDGKTLVREEFGQDAAAGKLRYSRCV